jgi:hypothetical protein
MRDDIACPARPVGSLDGVDLERQVAALMDDVPIDDAFDQGGCGVIRCRPVDRDALVAQAV